MNLQDYAPIGNTLRRNRESMQMSLEQAAGVMHIRPRYLSALENGTLGELPGLPYARGYLRSYAQLLGLDESQLLQQFEQAATGLQRRGFYLPQTLVHEKKPTGALIKASLAALVAVYAVWYTAYRPADSVPEIIDKPPLPPQAVPLPVVQIPTGPCFRASGTLYPPCYFQATPYRFASRVALISLRSAPAARVRAGAPHADDAKNKP